MFGFRLSLNRVSLGRKGFSSVFFVRFSVRSRRSSGGPFWTPGGPQNRLQIGPVAPARLGVAPGAVSGLPGEPPGPVWGPKREVPTLTIVWFFTVETHFCNFQRGSRKKRGKTRKSKLKLMRFWPRRVLEGLQKFVFSDLFFQRFF